MGVLCLNLAAESAVPPCVTEALSYPAGCSKEGKRTLETLMHHHMADRQAQMQLDIWEANDDIKSGVVTKRLRGSINFNHLDKKKKDE